MGWFAITILLPCLAPLLASLTFKLLTLPEGVAASPMKAFRDGQLCWTAIGFCAAGQYELAQQHVGPGWPHGLLTVILVLSSLLAAGGAMFPTAARCSSRWLVRYRCFVSSIALALIAGATYCAIHFELWR